VAADRQIGQCRAFVLQAVGDLGRHGFLKSPDLRSMIQEKLDNLATRQKAGEIDDLWPYFRATWTNWVRTESDALRDRSMVLGAHLTQRVEQALRLGARAPSACPSSSNAASASKSPPPAVKRTKRGPGREV
jgi:hypothetical protein